MLSLLKINNIYFNTKTLEDIKQKNPSKTYCLKIGDPIEKAELVGTTTDPQIGFYIYDNRYSNVSFYGEKKFYSNSCKTKKTGTKEEGILIYESKKFSAYPTAIGNKLYILTNDNCP